MQADMPIVFSEKQLRDRSGGAERQRGGDGQVIAFRMATDRPRLLNAIPSRVHHPARGIDGGGDGAV